MVTGVALAKLGFGRKRQSGLGYRETHCISSESSSCSTYSNYNNN